jgi:MAF protein
LIESFLIISPDIDEAHEEGERPEQHVARISELKAQAGRKLVSNLSDKELVIIAADTIVVDGERILGKPTNEADAVAMLTELRGRTHTVYSGFAVYDTSQENLRKQTVSSDVLMREYTEDEIKAYVASGDPMDKAGAYAIQNHGFDPAPEFAGCFANVMGLPLCHLSIILKEMGSPGYSDVTERCQSSINYKCPISASILSGKYGKESV